MLRSISVLLRLKSIQTSLMSRCGLGLTGLSSVLSSLTASRFVDVFIYASRSVGLVVLHQRRRFYIPSRQKRRVADVQIRPHLCYRSPVCVFASGILSFSRSSFRFSSSIFCAIHPSTSPTAKVIH